MDLSKFEGLAKSFDEGVEVKLRGPNGEPTDLRVWVASYQSQRVKKKQRMIANARLREMQRNPKKVTTVEETEAKAHDIVIAAVLRWEGFEQDGKVLELTPENLRAILENPDLWFIGEQIDKAADDQQLFIKASA